jgi:hypothetical protein
MPIITALRRLTQEDYELQASLGSGMILCLKKNKEFL